MKINKVFRENKDGVLNIFYTAGYPKLNSTVPIAQYLAKAGVKLIEIGMPYSDPLADGETIQHSSEVALKNGMNLDIMFEQVQVISETTEITIILMGYLNQLMSVGVEQFLKKCKTSGVSGLIIPDLPMEIFKTTYQDLFKLYNIDISFLITPGTSVERILEADHLSSGFLYLVSNNSITGGVSTNFSKEQLTYFERIHNLKLSSPILIGFGIKTADQYKLTKKYANGAIIGSEFIRHLSTTEQEYQEPISAFISSIIKG